MKSPLKSLLIMQMSSLRRRSSQLQRSASVGICRLSDWTTSLAELPNFCITYREVFSFNLSRLDWYFCELHFIYPSFLTLRVHRSCHIVRPLGLPAMSRPWRRPCEYAQLTSGRVNRPVGHRTVLNRPVAEKSAWPRTCFRRATFTRTRTTPEVQPPFFTKSPKRVYRLVYSGEKLEFKIWRHKYI